MEINKTNVVLTGLPRSGTTLTCHLLNKLPDTVALHEPITYGRFDPEDEEAILDGIEQFYRRMRRMIRTQGVAVSKNVGGIITNRRDLVLVTKQPAMFSALLPSLVDRFPYYTIVRNPLFVLASWNSVVLNVHDGRSPGAEG